MYFFLMSCIFYAKSKKSLHYWRSQKITPMCSSKNFIVLAATFRYMYDSTWFNFYLSSERGIQVQNYGFWPRQLDVAISITDVVLLLELLAPTPASWGKNNIPDMISKVLFPQMVFSWTFSVICVTCSILCFPAWRWDLLWKGDGTKTNENNIILAKLTKEYHVLNTLS